MILNPWDVESQRIHTEDGVMSTLYRKAGGGGFCILVSKTKEREPRNDTQPMGCPKQTHSFC